MTLSAPIFHLKRRAKDLARAHAIPLHAALDRLARDEGFRSWSHLAAVQAKRAAPPISEADFSAQAAEEIEAQIAPGSLVLLAARPRQGKTRIALHLALRSARAGRRGAFFTLDYGAADMRHHLAALGQDPDALPRSFLLDTSDAISADHVAACLGTADRPGIAAIDYLQLLDQRRTLPDLDTQVRTLRHVARTTGTTVIALSQIDRTFDPGVKALPDLADLRLPNPIDVTLFDRACFLHAGALEIRPAA